MRLVAPCVTALTDPRRLSVFIHIDESNKGLRGVFVEDSIILNHLNV